MNLEELPGQQPEHLRSSKVPESLVQCIRGGVRPTVATKFVEDWLKGELKSLALVGPPGTGKSVAAAWAIANNLVAYDVFRYEPKDLPQDWRFRSALFVQAQDLAWPREAFEDTLPVLRRAKTCALLVIDDCGTENGDGERGLDAVFRARMDSEGKRTILTSNLLEGSERMKPPTGFRGRYGRRILSRLLGSGRIVVCDGSDLRQTNLIIPFQSSASVG